MVVLIPVLHEIEDIEEMQSYLQIVQTLISL